MRLFNDVVEVEQWEREARPMYPVSILMEGTEDEPVVQLTLMGPCRCGWLVAEHASDVAEAEYLWCCLEN